MDNNAEKMVLTDVVYDDTGERILECDFIVPDYYPDILQIIATEAVPHLRTKKVEDGKAILEGFTEFRVYYISEIGGKLCSISYPQDFSIVFDLSGQFENPYMKAKLWVTSSSCKALNPRKLAPKATVCTHVRVWDTQNHGDTNYDEDNFIQINRSETEAFFFSSATPKITTVSEDAQIPSTFPQARSILRNDCFISVTDVKPMTDKAIVRAIANVKILYSCDDDNTAEVEFELPFTHIIDMVDANEYGDWETDYEVTDIVCNLKQDDDDESRLIAIDIELCGTARCMENRTVSAITDAYSTEYNCNTKASTLSFDTLSGSSRKHISNKMDLDLDRDASEFITCYGNIRPLSAICDGGTTACNMELNITAIAKSEDNEYFSVNKKLPLSLESELKSAPGDRFEQDIAVTGISGRFDGGKVVQIKYEMDHTVSAFKRNTVNTITEIDVDASVPKNKPKTLPVTIYYGKKDERIWDIAKKYNSTVSAITDANDIIAGNLDKDEILIIPKRTY